MKKILIRLIAITMPLAVSCKKDNPDIFTYKVGNYEVILLSEVQGTGKSNILIGATSEMMRKTIPDGTFPNAVNTFLVKTPEKNYLIDTGFGRNLEKNLKAVGVLPAQIETVIITHLHGDHIGGLLKGEVAAFPHSNLVLSAIEQAYWIDSLKDEKASKAISKYDKIEIVRPEKLGEKTGDGIFFIEAYGHTPGHMACLIQSGKERLLIWADLAHSMAIQMPYPEVAVTYDTDPVMATESRKLILEYVAKNNIPIAGMHIPYPGMGNVEAMATGGYRFIPLPATRTLFTNKKTVQ